MTYQEYIRLHIIAADYKENRNRCEPILMLSIENAEGACRVAEYNLARKLLALSDSARIESLEKIIRNFKL
jgi:hypothetical protein